MYNTDSISSKLKNIDVKFSPFNASILIFLVHYCLESFSLLDVYGSYFNTNDTGIIPFSRRSIFGSNAYGRQKPFCPRKFKRRDLISRDNSHSWMQIIANAGCDSQAFSREHYRDLRLAGVGRRLYLYPRKALIVRLPSH